MKYEDVMSMLDRGELLDEYSQYIMDNCGGERIICNGHTLIDAIEDGYLLDEFVVSYLEARS